MTPTPAGVPPMDIGVLVTRPREQADGLMQALQARGMRPIPFPALAILPPRDPHLIEARLRELASFHLAVFVSPTAAQRGLAALAALGLDWPATVAMAAVGAGTAQALARLGAGPVLHPQEGGDSEHLLALLDGLPAWRDMTGKRVLILRGEQGRETLGQALAARGAEVVHLACYRRGMPEGADPAPIRAQLASGGVHAVTVYSSETLDNLLRLLGEDAAALRPLPLFVPHPRIATQAQALGLTRVVTCPGGDAQIAAGIVEYFRHD